MAREKRKRRQRVACAASDPSNALHHLSFDRLKRTWVLRVCIDQGKGRVGMRVKRALRTEDPKVAAQIRDSVFWFLNQAEALAPGFGRGRAAEFLSEDREEVMEGGEPGSGEREA